MKTVIYVLQAVRDILGQWTLGSWRSRRSLLFCCFLLREDRRAYSLAFASPLVCPMHLKGHLYCLVLCMTAPRAVLHARGRIDPVKGALAEREGEGIGRRCEVYDWATSSEAAYDGGSLVVIWIFCAAGCVSLNAGHAVPCCGIPTLPYACVSALEIRIPCPTSLKCTGYRDRYFFCAPDGLCRLFHPLAFSSVVVNVQRQDLGCQYRCGCRGEPCLEEVRTQIE